jgi:hypothetical protein
VTRPYKIRFSLVDTSALLMSPLPDCPVTLSLSAPSTMSTFEARKVWLMGVDPIGSVEISRLCEARKDEAEPDDEEKVLKSTRSWAPASGGRFQTEDEDELVEGEEPVGWDPGLDADELECRFRGEDAVDVGRSPSSS